ncbi:MAG: hypothetical protein ABWX96_02390, partial [Propionibacteriaceae bacterium]
MATSRRRSRRKLWSLVLPGLLIVGLAAVLGVRHVQAASAAADRYVATTASRGSVTQTLQG